MHPRVLLYVFNMHVILNKQFCIKSHARARARARAYIFLISHLFVASWVSQSV
jgi:hypothetical protein